MSSLSSSESRKDTPGISNGTNAKIVLNHEDDCEGVSPNKPEGKVMVLYTGGTIGMLKNKEGVLVPANIDEFIKAVRKFPHLHDSEYVSRNCGKLGESYLALPETAADNRRVVYRMSKFSNVCDSSNITMIDWICIAKYIKEWYDNYDGFVILHGTDTLSYTASVLSFMFENLGKPVILTGSQVPIFQPRSDGLDNFLASLVIAASYNIPEVCIFFGTNLMRGNRTSKVSAFCFDAFQSPNCLPLATAHIKIKVEYSSFFRPCTLQKFEVHTSLNENVGLLRLFPGITHELVRAFLQPPTLGVVLQSYGSGNIPTNRKDIIDALHEATTRGVIIVNITQCMTGSVSDMYEAGRLLRKTGVTSGFDMTPEAALTKLAYVLSKNEWDTDTKRLMMETNLRGELTAGRLPNNGESDLMKAVEQSLRLSSTEEIQEMKSYLLPAMMNDATIKRDIMKLKQLKECKVDMTQGNADGRTALHIACCGGNIEIVRYLLTVGANVHARDRFDRTPLTDAIENDYHETISILRMCGAHLHWERELIGEKMCAAAVIGNIKRLQSYCLAGADISQANFSGQTPLHFAILHRHKKMIKYLLEHDADPRCADMLGQIPADLVNISSAIPKRISGQSKEQSKAKLLTLLDL